ncbi:fused response regulator/phosphatase [Methylococcus geothermalis]|uniref:SpoIIE family protein phosphatase n=1 Tax=Methylococcus geothermalis TaxID=2681310 RepID=A0A858Q673_9GAMM|nr:fused response regulator/phosphatase [Methylococcus geothermalis]QJD29340.1 SpoIIE family protein phosphatase [Methylococcus geothermalis]
MSEEKGRVTALAVAHPVVVLLIDDQKIIGEAVRRLLKDETDIEFHFLSDPTQALAEAERVRPTIILQDLVMPEVDGLDLVVRFREHPASRDIPLIVLSSKEEPTVKAEAFARGANDYLVKLPDRIELIARLRYHSNAYIAQLQRDEAYGALAAELHEAASYVRSQLPAPILAGPIRSAWEFVPSTTLGGDSFGYFDVDPGHFAFFLLDVCGHGVGPALLSVSAMAAISQRTLPEVDLLDPASVLGALNEAFAMEKHNLLYFTIWYGVFDRATRTVRYASAGHPPAVVIPAGGAPVELRQQAMPIGVMGDASFPAAAFRLPPAATVYLFSDGIYEVTRPGGEEFTFGEFMDQLASVASSGGGPMEILAAMRDIQNSAEFEDDVSVLALKFD